MRKLPIGLSDFKELIQEKYYYINKDIWLSGLNKWGHYTISLTIFI
jgi:hypothetical protein